MIKTWQQRCEEHPAHNGIVTHSMIQERMQEEIDELRDSHDALLKSMYLMQIDCQHLHHARKDRHALSEPCPVVARIEGLMAKARSKP